MTAPNGRPTGTGAAGLQSIADNEAPWGAKYRANQDAIQQEMTNLENVAEIYSYRWLDATSMNAETTQRQGDLGFRKDLDQLFRYDGTQWVLWETRDQRWTPAPVASGGGFTLGTDTSGSSFWSVDGDGCVIDFRAVLGTGPSFGTGYVTIPTPLSVRVGAAAIGTYKRSGSDYPQPILAWTSTKDAIRVDLLNERTDGTAVNAAALAGLTAESGGVLAFSLACSRY